ncbi:phage portal protein [Clostridium pasteurianum]|uniref:Phage portal protein, SPP1 Gp6 n=1 Tax=Clostridium pasteurianum BC1 TaxID=86416 RepID=R4K7F2_CLOPA|nr:phage portal protein [Clostridium pasteurianum]AGK97636.1 Phage portal protein, SPP1 Gp6 [Clostridium pasteurianum BC1]
MFDIEANRSILEACFSQFQTQWRIYQRMYFYYMGITDINHNLAWQMDGNYDDIIFNNYADAEGGGYSFINDRSHNKINTNFIKKFIKEEISYSVGNPITYSSKSADKNIVNILKENTWHWDENTDASLAKNMLIYSTAFELYYIDKDAQFCSKIISPRHGIMYNDDFGNPIFFLHIYRKTYDSQMYIDIYDNSQIIHCNEAFAEISPRQSHPFGIVPVGTAQISEESWLDSIYQDMKSLQDAYERNLSDISSEITEFRNAYLCFINCELDENELDKIRKDGIMKFKGNGSTTGSAQWLTKQINDTFIQNTLNTIIDLMYQISGHINHNIKESSNTSSLALRAKLIGLEDKCKLNQKSLHNCVKTRLQCLFTYLNSLKGSQLYDVKDILVTFTANIPQDDLQNANMVNTLGNRLSTQTALSLFSFVSDPEREMQQAQKEQEASTVGSDLLDQARAQSNQSSSQDKNMMNSGDMNGKDKPAV